MNENKEKIKIPDPDYFDTRELLELMQNLNETDKDEPEKELEKADEPITNKSSSDKTDSATLKMVKKPRNRWLKVNVH